MKITVTKVMNGYIVNFFDNGATNSTFNETYIAKDNDELVKHIENATEEIIYIASMEKGDEE